jgi:hypothetical protein
MIILKNTFYAKVTSTKNQLIDWRQAKLILTCQFFSRQELFAKE